MEYILIMVFLALVYMLSWLKKSKKKNFNFRVLTALVVGIIFGAIVQMLFGASSDETNGLVTFM